MRFSISETAEWGDVSVGPTIIDNATKNKMKRALKNSNGQFAEEWIKENRKGKSNLISLENKVPNTGSKKSEKDCAA